MKAILFISLFTATSAFADATPASELARAETALVAARTEMQTARARWDEAVAGEHPNPAGKWARRHFVAMQKVKAAEQRWQAAKDHGDRAVARR